MNKTLAICLLIMVASATTSDLFEQFPLNFTPKRSIMTLLTQVEAKLKSGGPLDAITKMLADFKQTITEEQVNHDNLFAKQQAECASEYEFRTKEVSDATAAFKEATETLDGCTAQRLRAAGDLSITKKQLTENRSYLAVIIDTRRQGANDFQQTTDAYQNIIKVIEEALVILEEIWSGEKSFADLARHANGLLKNVVHVNKAALLSPILGALVQLASSSEIAADEALLNRVKTLLNNLKDKFESEFQNIVENENKAIADHADDRTRVEGIITNLGENSEGLTSELFDLDKCIVNQTGIVQTAAAKRDRNQKLWDDATALCTACEDEYKSASKSRRQELKLLAAIQERVEARFANLSEGVTERGEADSFSYENKSAYDKKSFQA